MRRVPAGLIACIAAVVLGVAALALAGGAAQAQDGSAGFVGGIEDLPLMAGLVEDVAAGLVFDKPEGRIVEALAAGPLERAAVEAFYAATLVQLGWQPSGDGAYKREGEALRITVSGEDGAVTVHFSLAPD